MPKVMLAVNTTWNLINFRSGLIRALIDVGYEVIAVAPPDEYVPHVQGLGCRFISLSMDNKGTNPAHDFLLLWRFYCLLFRERPDVYIGYTVKPNIYGSLAARTLGIPIINNITGLGVAFLRNTWLTRLVRELYRLALSGSATVFFQNADDRQFFLSSGLVSQAVTVLLPGSGIDLARFTPEPLPSQSPIRFLLVARMLWDKGVGEFVEAARLINRHGTKAEFCLLGFLDVKNPAAISRKQMDDWVDEGVIRYLGVSDDVRTQIQQADCVVLPSYREGTPRCLLEAAAMGRPIVTTDAVGCREVVNDGVNGYLCQIQDALDLADKLTSVVELSSSDRQAMGARGRVKVEREYDERLVVEKHIKAIENALANHGVRAK